MILLIFGSRAVTSVHALHAALDEWGHEDEVTHVIGGEAEGADTLGRCWAEAKGLAYKGFPAAWNDIPDDARPNQIGWSKEHGRYYKPAGVIRNLVMADHLVAARQQGYTVAALGLMVAGGSKGSMQMLGLLRAEGIKPYVKEFDLTTKADR